MSSSNIRSKRPAFDAFRIFTFFLWVKVVVDDIGVEIFKAVISMLTELKTEYWNPFRGVVLSI